MYKLKNLSCHSSQKSNLINYYVVPAYHLTFYMTFLPDFQIAIFPVEVLTTFLCNKSLVVYFQKNHEIPIERPLNYQYMAVLDGEGYFGVVVLLCTYV